MELTEREKAYHDGYEQGRFDEYAERMGYDQAEKVKAKIDKQKNCPYCHVPYKPFISTGIETDLDLGSGNGPVYEVISNVLGKGPIMETTLGIINILKFPNCPFCKRPLNEEEE